MTTLAESFLNDLDESSEEDNDQVAAHVGTFNDMQNDMAEESDADADADNVDELPNQPTKDQLSQIITLYKSKRLRDFLDFLHHSMESGISKSLGEEQEFTTIMKCNKLIVEIDDETDAVFKYLRDLYSVCFPELERLIPLSLDYAKVVKHLGDTKDIAQIDLSGILPPETVMSIAMTSSTTSSHGELPSQTLKQCFDASDAIIELHDVKTHILVYVESRLGIYAPNLTALIGSGPASRIIGIAGGLANLAAIPACDIMVLGHNRKVDFSGFSKVASGVHEGILKQCDLVARAPSHLRKKALKLISAKVALAARIDSYNTDLKVSDARGREYRDEITKQLQRLMEPDKKKQFKALPAPIEKPRKKRGGKRFRKMKEKYEITDISKQRNRMAFGTEEVESYDGMELGMINVSGRVRLQTKDTQKLGKSAAAKNKFKNRFGSNSGIVSGFSSSLAFTPVQGLELINPNAAEEKIAKLRAINEKYFNSAAGFKQVAPSTVHKKE